jgi:hypothetical protein
VLDADIRGFFDALNHEWLVKFIEHRIADPRVIRHVRKWLNAGVLEQGRLMAGCYPGSEIPTEAESKAHALVRAGIRHVVSLMEADERDRRGRPFVPYDWALAAAGGAAGADITVARFPIRDMSVASPDLMVRILDDIDQSIEAGRPVHVHRWGGHGRTGTVVGCWLARHGIAEGHAALERIRTLRQKLADDNAASPETPGQEAMVVGWRRGQ